MCPTNNAVLYTSQGWLNFLYFLQHHDSVDLWSADNCSICKALSVQLLPPQMSASPLFVQRIIPASTSNPAPSSLKCIPSLSSELTNTVSKELMGLGTPQWARRDRMEIKLYIVSWKRKHFNYSKQASFCWETCLPQWSTHWQHLFHLWSATLFIF